MSTAKPRNDRDKFEKPKSKLFTPDPYYIPGYCGYCPMKKFQLGDTYGKTTADILTDDSIAKSASLVLKRKVMDKGDKSSRIKKQTREKKQGEPTYNIISGDMIPGYTGYIAKSEKYFADRFAVICDHATHDIMEKKMRFTETKNRTNRRKNFQVFVLLIRKLLNIARPLRNRLEHHHTLPMMTKKKALYRVILVLFHMLDPDMLKGIQMRRVML